MKATVCQLHSDPEEMANDWQGLVAHEKQSHSELVLLPEMPFYTWIFHRSSFDVSEWQASVVAHNQWMSRLDELSPAIVLGTRPVERNAQRRNEGFIWQPGDGARPVHTKYYLPDETDFWEASWYSRGERRFESFRTQQAVIGMQICTEMWFTEHARKYGIENAHILAIPRATDKINADKWVAGGQTVAVVAGAFCLSSNRCSLDQNGIEWAGQGWIISPDGDLLALTSQEEPFITLEIDMKLAEHAKKTYPRYVPE